MALQLGIGMAPDVGDEPVGLGGSDPFDPAHGRIRIASAAPLGKPPALEDTEHPER
jgi:hypothetical protein